MGYTSGKGQLSLENGSSDRGLLTCNEEILWKYLLNRVNQRCSRVPSYSYLAEML